MINKTMSVSAFLLTAPNEAPTQTPLFDFSNWQLIRSIDSFNQSLKNFGDNTKDFFDTVKTIHQYFTNPMLIWNGFISISFWLCLIICVSSFLIYLMTNRKKDLYNSKYAFAVWIILKILDLSIRGA